MIAGNEEHPSDFRQGLAAASQPLWLYVAGWLVVALDLKYTRTTTIGVSVSSCSLDVLPDVLGVCMMAAAGVTAS